VKLRDCTGPVVDIILQCDRQTDGRSLTTWYYHRLAELIRGKNCQNCIISAGVLVPERGGTPSRQIFLSRNGAPVNIVYHIRNADTEAFRQISSYYKKVTLYTKYSQMVLRKIIEIVATRCHVLRLNAPNSISAGALPQTR